MHFHYLNRSSNITLLLQESSTKRMIDEHWPWQVWVGEWFFWYWLTQVVQDKIQRAVKWL